MSRVFNGTSDFITINASATMDQLLPAYTIASWVFLEAANEGLFAMANLSFDNDANTNGLESIVQTSASGALSVAPNDAMPLGSWHHIATTYNDSGDRLTRIYVDGVETSYTASRTAATGTADTVVGFPFLIGTDGFNDFAEGMVAELRVYKAALTGVQIAAIAADTTGNPNAGGAQVSLIAYLHLCGMASPEPDSSGNSNVGILTGTTGGANSPGYSGCGAPPPSDPYSVPDCRNYATFPNNSIEVNATKTYTVPSVDSRVAGAPVDSRAAGAPVPSGTYPQNSRAPGLYGPNEP